MFIQYVVLAVLVGAIACGLIYLWTKDAALAGILAAAIGILCVVFAFPSPKHADSLGDMADNATLFIFKGISIVAWLVGSFGSAWILKHKQS